MFLKNVLKQTWKSFNTKFRPQEKKLASKGTSVKRPKAVFQKILIWEGKPIDNLLQSHFRHLKLYSNPPTWLILVITADVIMGVVIITLHLYSLHLFSHQRCWYWWLHWPEVSLISTPLEREKIEVHIFERVKLPPVEDVHLTFSSHIFPSK